MNRDRDHDPDRLVGAWLDEGPRTFSPRRLDRMLTEIHGTPRQRQRPLPWSPPRMNLTFLTGLAGAAALAVLFAASAFLPWLPATIFGPAGSPTPSLVATPVPTPSPGGSESATASPVASPVGTTFLAGDVPFEGTTWRLVGRIDGARREGEPTFISAVPDAAATVRFEAGVMDGSDGCHGLIGAYVADPRGSRTAPADITLEPLGDIPACPDALRAQHLAVREGLAGAGGVQLTTAGVDILASGISDADLDGRLRAHYEGNPDLLRLIVRDQSGEGTLVFAPVGRFVAPPDIAVLSAPQPFLDTDWRFEAVTDGSGGLAGVSLGSGAGIRFWSEDGSDRFEMETGCADIDGDWALGPRKGGGEARTLDLVLGAAVLRGCTTTPDQAEAIRSAVMAVGSIEAIDGPVHPGTLGLTADALDLGLRRELAVHRQASRQLLRDRLGAPLLLLIAAAPDQPGSSPGAPR